jgi:Peptidase family M28
MMGSEEQALAPRLQKHVEELAGKIGERNVFCPAALQAAASYIEHEWQQQGYAVRRIAYDVSGVPCLNLEITRSGGARQREILLIGAHYDTVPGSPGANDNTSGVSALLELSRLFVDIEPALTVRFVAFVNEEPPFFTTRQQGSMMYAETARRRGDDIRLMASVETIGWYSSEPGSQRYPPLFNFFYPDRAKLHRSCFEFPFAGSNAAACGGVSCEYGFPARDCGDFLVCSRSLLERSSLVLAPRLSRCDDHGYGIYRYRHYHQPSDTPDKLAYPELARVTSGLFSAFSELARGGVD